MYLWTWRFVCYKIYPQKEPLISKFQCYFGNRATGDEPQGTMGRVQTAVVSFPPSFARTFSSRERRLGTRQLHQRVEQNLSDMWRSTFETGEAQFRLVTEIVPKSLICVNGSSYECWRTGQGYQVQCTEHSPKFEPPISGKKGSQLELNQICTHNI